MLVSHPPGCSGLIVSVETVDSGCVGGPPALRRWSHKNLQHPQHGSRAVHFSFPTKPDLNICNLWRPAEALQLRPALPSLGILMMGPDGLLGFALLWGAAAVALLPPLGAERRVTTLSGDYLMLDSRCSTSETDLATGLRIGVLRQAPSQASGPNLMIALGGGGHTWEAWEDLASRVFERVLPCDDSGREPRLSLGRQHSLPRPDITAFACYPAPGPAQRPWVVVGAAARAGQSFATVEGCLQLVQLARSIQTRYNTTSAVHLSGASAGGIAALECAARHSEVFASVTAFAGFMETTDAAGTIGQTARGRATAAFRHKPVRIYVGDRDDLFHGLAEEQFGPAGNIRADSDTVRVLPGVGHEVFADLDLADLCSWMQALGAGTSLGPAPEKGRALDAL